jgi:cytochrome c-type biogenesis protein CcsB
MEIKLNTFLKPGFALFVSVFFLALPARAEVQVDQTMLSQMAVQERGRKKPMTTLMQENLLTLTGSSTYRPDEESKPRSAISTMLDVWMQPQLWRDRPIILIGYRPLQVDVMGLPRDRKYFSLREVASNPGFQTTLSEANRLRRQDAHAELNGAQKEVLQVAQRLDLLAAWLTGETPAVVPHPSRVQGQWVSIGQMKRYYNDPRADGMETGLQSLRVCYARDDSATFNAHLGNLITNLRHLTSGVSPEDAPGSSIYPAESMLAFEYFYQQFHPFRWAWIAYALALIILAVTSGWQERIGYRLGWTVLLAGFFLQIFGFACRIIISGRPPVTNMYETVIWLAFGTVLFAVILESIYRCRYFLLAAAPIAVVSLILADTQPTVLDSSIHPLVPVLRHNVWLIIHVLTITLSYAAFALALGLGHVVLFKTLLQRSSGASLNLVHLYLYRALQIGVLLLATGTILGGVWANYSWGRFWDWDPKETWALTTLLCYLALLHGRIAGWWGGFGLAVGSILCFQAVLMAWYGVNFVLGKGLHSYGFGSGGYPFAAAFAGTELLIAGASIVIYRRRRDTVA